MTRSRPAFAAVLFFAASAGLCAPPPLALAAETSSPAAVSPEEAFSIAREGYEMLMPLVIMDLTVPGGMGGKEAIGHLISLDPKATAIVSSCRTMGDAITKARQRLKDLAKRFQRNLPSKVVPIPASIVSRKRFSSKAPLERSAQTAGQPRP